ncbi:MAG TPA: GNAT family N-acetyltransferase [Candidatus Gracilibacteria bacterium]|nr:GNAT family N-acetyltransferase [Candidatus Gracilibacteria bacterium]
MSEGQNTPKPDVSLEGVASQNEVPWVRRVAKEEDVRSYYQRIAEEKSGIDPFDPIDMEGLMEPYRSEIDGICRHVRNGIVWGVYGQEGELVRVVDVNGKVERLFPEDAKSFKALYLLGLQKEPEKFGSTYKDERNRSTQAFRKLMEERYVLGVSFKYQQADGKIKKRLVGTASVVSEEGLRSHIATFRTLIVDPAHRGRGIARSLNRHRLEYVMGQGIEIVEGIITATNQNVIKANEALGFRKKQIRHNAARLERRDEEGNIEYVYFDWQPMELDVKKLRR